LIILFVCLFKGKYRDETHRRRILTAIAVALGALASNFVLVFAKYYSLRSSCCFIFLSILATAILWGGEELPSPSRRMQKWLKVFSVALILAVVIGIADVGFTLYQVNQNEALIAEAVAQGEGSITLNCPIPWTKYNALSGLRYLSTDAQDPWPNIYLAKYYGIGEIHGSMAESPWIEWLLSY
jgi:hypothetical protein